MKRRILLLATGWIWVPGVAGAFNYDEAVSGDLSTNPAAPTPLAISLGPNRLAGSVTSGTPSDTRDYITFTIPAGQALTALKLLTYQQPGGVTGNRGFHAIALGPTSVAPASDGSNAGALLGGAHLDPAPSGTDLLPGLAADTIAATPGFALPLGPGTYTYHVQQTGPQISEYLLEFDVAATANVPALGVWAVAALSAGLAVAAVAIAGRRRLAT